MYKNLNCMDSCFFVNDPLYMHKPNKFIVTFSCLYFRYELFKINLHVLLTTPENAIYKLCGRKFEGRKLYRYNQVLFTSVYHSIEGMQFDQGKIVL